MAFEHSLLIRVARKHAYGVTIQCPLREDLLNSNGVLHGGVAASIADEAAWHAMLHAYGGDRPATTTELKVNYLRPLAGKKVIARTYTLPAVKTLHAPRAGLFGTQKRVAAP